MVRLHILSLLVILSGAQVSLAGEVCVPPNPFTHPETCSLGDKEDVFEEAPLSEPVHEAVATDMPDEGIAPGWMHGTMRAKRR